LVIAAKKERRILDLGDLSARRTCKVRYGRARLTIDRWGPIIVSPTYEALQGWRRGEKTSEDVAWAFVRTRVREHTPSFCWEEADEEYATPPLIKRMIASGRLGRKSGRGFYEYEDEGK
jgi:hypothetical protein